MGIARSEVIVVVVVGGGVVVIAAADVVGGGGSSGGGGGGGKGCGAWKLAKGINELASSGRRSWCCAVKHQNGAQTS